MKVNIIFELFQILSLIILSIVLVFTQDSIYYGLILFLILLPVSSLVNLLYIFGTSKPGVIQIDRVDGKNRRVRLTLDETPDELEDHQLVLFQIKKEDAN